MLKTEPDGVYVKAVGFSLTALFIRLKYFFRKLKIILAIFK